MTELVLMKQMILPFKEIFLFVGDEVELNNDNLRAYLLPPYYKKGDKGIVTEVDYYKIQGRRFVHVIFNEYQFDKDWYLNVFNLKKVESKPDWSI